MPAQHFRPVVVDLQSLVWYHAARPPPPSIVAATRRALSSPGVWHVRNHGVDSSCISSTRTAARAFFDQPASSKLRMGVGHMDRSRGWELYPQHRRLMEATIAHSAESLQQLPGDVTTGECWSAWQGIVCERFVCGPPDVCSEPLSRAETPQYDSEWGRVFYERNVWPDGSELRPSMEALYPQMEHVARACLQCIAVALDAPHDAFDALVTSQSMEHPEAPVRHHSRLQANHYPAHYRCKLHHSVAVTYCLPPRMATCC